MRRFLADQTSLTKQLQQKKFKTILTKLIICHIDIQPNIDNIQASTLFPRHHFMMRNHVEVNTRLFFLNVGVNFCS